MAHSQFQKLLQTKYAEKTAPYNLIQMGAIRGRYFIDAFTEPLFWNFYTQAIVANQQLCLAEQPMPESVLRLDVDISIVNQYYVDEEKDDKTPESVLCYSIDQVKELIVIANNILKNMSCSPMSLNCSVFLLEKSARVISESNNVTKIKRGFHLHWPFVVLKLADAKEWLRQLINEVSNEKIFATEKCPIDQNTFDVPWLLYGSRKGDEVSKMGRVNHEPYLISQAFDSDCNEITPSALYDEIKLVDIYDESKFIVDPSIYWRMTIRPYGRKVVQCKPLNTDFFEIQMKSYDSLQNNVPIDLLHVQQLLEMLSLKRCTEYREWLNVGRCLYSITQGTIEGLQLWKDWSMNCIDKFSNSACETKWRTFTANSYGIGLLKNWAKTDNLKEYTLWKDKIFADSLTFLKMTTSGEIARIAAGIIGEHYKFFDNEWFCFSTHHWTSYLASGDGDVPLHKILNTKVKDAMKQAMSGLDPSKKNDEEKIKNFMTIIRKLDEPNTLKSIIEMLRLEYFDNTFKSKLDTNALTIGLKNGVYDLDKCIFREGVPEDCISRTLNCKYIEYDMNSPEIKSIEKHLMCFFPNPARRKYMLDTLCQVFVGNLYMKYLFFWVGNGDNGKTAFSRLLEEMLGRDYCVKMPTTLLSSAKMDAGKAAPELCQLRGKRLAFFDEPDASEALSNGTLKILTGRDSMAPRELFEKGKDIKTFVPLCQYVFVCNNEPNVKNPDDPALWNRFRVCEFESRFLPEKEVPPTFEEQLLAKKFPMNPNFTNEIKELAAPFCYYLLCHWKLTKGKNLETPDCVISATQNYRASTNKLLGFISEELEQDKDSVVVLDEFKNRFFEYLSKTSMCKVAPLSTAKIIECLRKAGIDVDQSGVVGYRFVR
jgi:P4 family phage/plasmid primase-like protien